MTKQVAYVREEMLPEKAPPPSTTGVIGWMRQNLFDGWMNSILTILSLALVVYVLDHFLPWAFRSSWSAHSLDQCREAIKAAYGPEASGACWAVIRERYLQLLYGFYPSEFYWRPNLAFLLLLVALAPVLFTNLPRKMLWFSLVFPLVGFWLLWGGSVWLPVSILIGFVLTYAVATAVGNSRGLLWGVIAGVVAFLFLFMDPLSWVLNLWGWITGSAAEAVAVAASGAAAEGEQGFSARDIFPLVGVIRQWLDGLMPFGLEQVESRNFGGFMLSITIGITGIAASLPLGILLALGRKSDLLILKSLSVGFIEFIRGVPLITLLFVASTLLNIFLPPGTNFDIILRVMIMVTLFSAAYIAEVVRGGLAALPKGQYEAADALGLDYWKSMRLIILPQALKISIPGIVSTFIGLFKDTTLVSIIGLLDPIGFSNAIRANAEWQGIVWELYFFIAAMFWVFCFSMSRYSMYLERKLQTGHR